MSAVKKTKEVLLVKTTSKKVHLWQVVVQGRNTTIQVGDGVEGWTSHKEADHGTVLKAKAFADRQVNFMLKKGYKFQPKMEKPKRKAVLPSTEEDDAASYASSTSTLDVQDSSLEAVGISPLNRKKLNSESSDQMESTDPFNPPIFMSSKSTVIMKSSVPERWSNWRRSKSSFVKKESEAPKVKRKQTVDMPLVTKSSSRVQEWREVGSFASQESQHDGQFRLDGTMTMTNDELDDNVAKQILLRKQSTTFALRHQLQGIDMVDATANIGHSGPLTRLKRKRSLEIADVSYDGDMMSAPLMKKQSTTFGIRQKLSGTKLSREPTLLLAPVKEERKRRLSTVKEEIISLDEPDSVTSPIAKKQKRVFSSSQVSSDIQNIKDEEQITNSSSTKKKRTRSVAFSSQDTMTPKPKKIRKSGSTLAAAAKEKTSLKSQSTLTSNKVKGRSKPRQGKLRVKTTKLIK